MNFDPENELERLLIDAAKSETARPAFLRGLLEHNLLIITDGRQPDASGQQVLPTDAEITVRQTEMNGKMYTPIFTSEKRIAAVITENVGYLAMKGRDLLETVRGNELVLNPGSAFGKFLTPLEIDALLDGSIFTDAPAHRADVGGKQILLGLPKNYPHHITDALSKFFAGRREIEAAYLAHSQLAGEPTPSTLIGVSTTGDDWQEFSRAIGPVIQAALKDGETVNLVQLGQPSSPIDDYMLRNTKPFYTRKKWFGLF